MNTDRRHKPLWIVVGCLLIAVSLDRAPILPLNPIECYLPSMEVAALDCAGLKSLPIKLAGPVGAVDKKCAIDAACSEDGQGGAFCANEARVSPPIEQPSIRLPPCR